MIERDVVVVGAGFAGLYALHRSRGAGLTAVGEITRPSE
jgi:cation diffusion facilitator CzcD-associated flavoprotein CzcO